MYQFLIIAFDSDKPGALEHRMEVRPRHLVHIAGYKDRGQYIIGGAQLNNENTMMGSALILQFDDPALIDDYIANEPYIIEGVWVDYKITPFKIANI